MPQVLRGDDGQNASPPFAAPCRLTAEATKSWRRRSTRRLLWRPSVKFSSLTAASALALAITPAPAVAQMNMPGMKMPATQVKSPRKAAKKPTKKNATKKDRKKPAVRHKKAA